MSANLLLQYGFFFAVLFLLAWPLGLYMARAYQGDLPAWMAWLRPLERGCYRLAGIHPDDDMGWRRYAGAVLAFSLLGVLAVYALQRLQLWLPFNPQAMANTTPDLAFNTAASFVTNTNWQSYGGETTMSYLTQMLGLAVQNFLSAATGMAVVVALMRGFQRKEAGGIGNFWVDMVRSTLYVLLPLSLILALALVSQGVVQSVAPYASVPLTQAVDYEQPKVGADGQPVLDAEGKPVLEAATAKEQTLALGPAASQIAIKHLGTNGGGFFNANSSHPYENPTPVSNLLQMLAIVLIPAALCFTFGRWVGDLRQGLAILAAMTAILVALLAVEVWAEQAGNPLFERFGLATQGSELMAGGNMEGKEARFGISATSLFITVTTAVSCGAVNAMHDSLTPLGGLVPMWLMQLGEVVFGGVGSGLYGMLVFAIVGVFVAGLMIGRTPEYLGKKIEAYEMKMAAVAILATPLAVLLGTALSVMVEAGTAGIFNPGAHGFSEVLYAFSSAANNNGSAFAGLGANTPYYNTALGLAMLFGRFMIIAAVLAIAGSLAAKKRIPPSAGTLPTHTPLFVVLLIGTVIVVGALTFLPSLALGPVVEHLQMVGIR
ncbi:potassium-transporting ATPase potassium-binding subunit [Azospira sp. I13]|uniref:potassium-transporting ATPase subunit KdpA n=1 Tax=Azospira sp. I13 TaxID=1765050 RepID=UPI000D4AAF50|nr:potassium-transporting ATPase subunit KdpA [Azospira sp. I13]GBG02589.1 potassium-transporting ATPase potassium-binding subunit [Azospira sp. I13]